MRITYAAFSKSGALRAAEGKRKNNVFVSKLYMAGFFCLFPDFNVLGNAVVVTFSISMIF